MNKSALKNRGRVLSLIARKKCLSRIELSRKTGLTKMTVSNIVAELIERNIVAETTAIETGGIGRNPVELTLAENGITLVGVQIHRDFCAALCCDLALNVIKSVKSPITNAFINNFPNELVKLIKQVIGRQTSGIGIASIGPLDSVRGVLLSPPNFYGISNIKLKEYVENAFSMPTVLDSQYNCAAMVERYFAQTDKDFIFVGLSNGVGAGVMCGGKIPENTQGLGVELGHVSIDINGKLCHCGAKGCLETYVGTNIICHDYHKMTGKNLSFEALCSQPDAMGLLMERSEILALGLNSVVNLFNPSSIIIGDQGVFLPKQCLELIENEINRLKLSGSIHKVCVKKPYFGIDAQLLGGACRIAHLIFTGNIDISNTTSL